MTTFPETNAGVSTEQDGGFSEEVADRQFERMLKEAEARLPEGYEIDWERGALVRSRPVITETSLVRSRLSRGLKRLMPKAKSSTPAKIEDFGGYSEAELIQQYERMLKEEEARLPEGYEYDWERGALVRLDPSLPRHPWCDHD